MKLSHIEIKNFLGVSRLSLDLHKPVTLICGPNASGKSSIQNAIKMAMLGTPTRVSLKKDYDQLIHHGQKKASVSVGTVDGDSYGLDLPKGAAIHSDNEFLPYVLDPSLFAKLPNKDRRTLLFKLTGSSCSTSKVKELLEARKCNMQLAERVLPLLRAGFPEAEKQCKENARDEKANWKATTGETWGSDKAEGWEPEPVEFDAEQLAELAEQFNKAEERFAELNRKLGSLDQQAQNRNYALDEKKRLAGLCEDVNRKLVARDSAQKRLDEQRERVKKYEVLAGEQGPDGAIPCPCCNVPLIMVDGALVEFKGTATDPEAVAKLEEHRAALATCEKAFNNAERDYKAAHDAQEKWKALEVPEPVSEDAITELQDEIRTVRDLKNGIQVDIDQLKDSKEKAANRQIAINQAEESHQNVLAWLELAEALGPDGIPSEIVSKALQPINDRMADSAADAKWITPRIDPSMDISAEGTPYHLLSESEQWRVDAMIGEAIAALSELRLLCLDRFDVIHPAVRGWALEWLRVLVEINEIDTVLIFGTMKSCPASKDFMDAYWIEGGELQEREPGMKKAS